ncbi:MAG: chemotaxis protein CheA [Arcobacteraceae bacterium]|nr:chemotaxis protein CheA [Arcobacteraceae bacterium]
MSNGKDRIINVFIEEAIEIIEQLETELMRLDESPEDKSIINEIFRGVHTLKGNANSFGFTKLGGFVHYFEDLLDYYRGSSNQLTPAVMQLIFDAYDIIKEVFEFDKNKIDGYPNGYESILKQIKDALNFEPLPVMDTMNDMNDVVEKHHFHHAKFNHQEIEKIEKEIKEKILSECQNDKMIYNIVMEFDNDIYLRGYNHTLFFKLFSTLGDVAKSYWYLDDNLPNIENFTTEVSYIKRISIYLISSEALSEIEDVFEFIAEDDEVGISLVDYALFEDLKKEEFQELVVEEEVVVSPNESQISNNTSGKVVAHSQAKSIRIESSKLDELFDSIGELVIAQSFIDQNELIRGLNNLEINQYLSMLNKTTRSIQNKVMNLRMIPIRDTFVKMKRVARDVSKKTNKEVELILSGEDTEIDKTMVDSLSEPLIHIIRNSIDHGIESTKEERVASQKDPIGRVYLSAMHKGSSFIIEIKDDGKGIDPSKILAKAIEKGIASSEESYTKEQILNFLLVPGFSTAATITDISGRGVGLDAVKQSIEAMKGKLQIESILGEGSIFRIILPLTLAIIDGLSVRVKDETFIIPTLSVVESFRAKKGDVQKAKGQGEFINFRGDILPVLQLGKLLGIDDSELCVEDTTLICIEHERGRYVLQVNELLGRQQVVIKSLSKRLASIKEISGAAIMGSGEIALILNTEGVREWLDCEFEAKDF